MALCIVGRLGFHPRLAHLLTLVPYIDQETEDGKQSAALHSSFRDGSEGPGPKPPILGVVQEMGLRASIEIKSRTFYSEL
uniref:Uncharacterized protein n=1 Tax=Physcomitrium patens TaxID=3218 RepID=A0A2K1IHG2_PHYPA|nr:hypothetical protein PHYPA_029301 [Physcomitrium patens]